MPLWRPPAAADGMRRKWALSLRRVVVVLGILCCLPVFALDQVRAQTAMPFLDAQTHLLRNPREARTLDTAAARALQMMDRMGVRAAILAPPPFPPSREGASGKLGQSGHPDAYGLPELAKVVSEHPDRFAFTAGGESLNPLIQETPADKVTPAVMHRFGQAAEAIVRGGAAGFGELAAEHFGNQEGVPYESAPPDHPLFLALADFAARADIPLCLHMEAVPQDMPLPRPMLANPAAPPMLHANISALERLLDHNPKARIVWLHAGWDLTGERTVALMRRLLAQHPNLYMSVKMDDKGIRRTAPLSDDGMLKPGWAALLRAFPDRFVIGSDQFFDDPPGRITRARLIVDALPPDVARMIVTDNVKHIYHVPRFGE